MRQSFRKYSLAPACNNQLENTPGQPCATVTLKMLLDNRVRQWIKKYSWTPVNFLKLMKPDLYNCFESSFWTVWWCSFLVYMPFSWRNSFVNIWYLVGVNMNELVDKPLNKEFSSLFVPFTSTSSSTSTKTTKKKKQLKRKVNLISIQKSERLNEIRIQEFFKHFFQHIVDLKRLYNCYKCVNHQKV